MLHSLRSHFLSVFSCFCINNLAVSSQISGYRQEPKKQQSSTGSLLKVPVCKRMSQDWRIGRLIGPFWNGEYLASFKAKLAVVVLTFFCKGLLSQNSEYTLMVPASVSVRQSHRVHVPCQFAFPHQDSSEQLHGYWFKQESHGNWPSIRPGPLVATNDKKAAVDRSAANRFQFVGDPNQGNCSFSINHTQREDEGKYCFRIERGSLKYTYVSNGHRSHTSLLILVIESPRVVKILANITTQGYAGLCSQTAKGDVDSVVVREGGSIILYCDAEGRPDPTLSWMKGNKTLNGSKEGQEHRLWLSEVRPEDAGKYQCRAETPYGSDKKSLQLCVQYAPRLSSTRPNSTCRHEGNNLLCTCSLHSWPPPQIQWQVDGETINESIPGEVLRVTFQAQGNELTSILNWTRRSRNRQHRIICFATSPSGAYTLQFVLHSSLTSTPPNILLSALCGPLVTASLFLFGMCLIRFWKHRNVSSRSKGQQVPNDAGEVYSNIMHREGVTHGGILQDPVSRYSGIYCNLQPPESITYSCVLPE